jgi:hypothetical protein
MHRLSLPLACCAALWFVTSCQTGGGFARYDSDKDRSLNFDEFAATPVGKVSPDAGAAFISADSDRDGALSHSEYEFYASSFGGR